MAYLFDDYAGRVVLRGVGSYMGIRANLNVDVKKPKITNYSVRDILKSFRSAVNNCYIIQYCCLTSISILI